MTDEERDAAYRHEGWGRVTDKALGISPSNVESQARRVAEWAFDAIGCLADAISHPEDTVAQEAARGILASVAEPLEATGSKPNIQQLPLSTPEAARVKEALQEPMPEADYSAMEQRVLASMAGFTVDVPGPWAVDVIDGHWCAINRATGRTKISGKVRQPGSRSKVNYFDRAMELANQRNAALSRKNKP
jgi:hypothetical protein